MNIPNSITFSRLLGIPIILYTLKTPTNQNLWISLVIFLIASATDFKGEIIWDLSKPDGTPKKQLNINRRIA